MKKRIMSSLVAIATILTLFLGTVAGVKASCKVVLTTCKLVSISLYIDDYNNLEVKTDEDTKRVEEQFAERKALYESEDWVIRVFSNLGIVLKLLVAIIALIMIPGFPVLFFLNFLWMSNRIVKIWQRPKHPKRRITPSR